MIGTRKLRKRWRRLELEWNGKILILSDIHYPFCDVNEINEIIVNEKPSLIILLGDIIVSNEEDYRKFLSNLKIRKNIIYVKGDEDKCRGDFDIIRVKNNGKYYTLLHGHQFVNEEKEYSIANKLRKINEDIPPFLFCVFFRVMLRNFKDTLVLGHSHALRYFKSIRCANAGTLTSLQNLYNDKGYVVIDRDGIRVVNRRV
ncbi:metallophosphoesterase family protein [Sulfolobus tengchongensis]|uniref:Metallophosphoesterase family protein n=1 Tax=Sulfolobus tengchongensis TaxID=207809 RepID=A0AAX4KXN4_9CREN